MKAEAAELRQNVVYGEEDQQTWRVLAERYMKGNFKFASREYQQGFGLLNLYEREIFRVEDLSRRLQALSGWSLVPVAGLIPTRDFFYMLSNQRYPITTFIRRPSELDFSEQPDIFHDIFGHVPMLTNDEFISFLSALSIVALNNIYDERAVECLGRLYWFTYEMGLVLEDGKAKPYGGAILTSVSEMENVNDPKTIRHAFNIEKIFDTPYNPYKLQREYFIIESFDELFGCAENLERKLGDYILLS